MKIQNLLLLILLSMTLRLFSINIEYSNYSGQDRLSSIKIKEMNYYSLSEFRQILRTGNYFVDYENNKINFTLFDESIIIYLNTYLVSFKGNLNNLSYPVVYQNNDFLLPKTFFSQTLVSIFPDKFSWNNTSQTLLTERPVDKRISRIVIDPGHGGKDPGAVGKRSREKDIVLDIAKKLKKELEEKLDIQVLLTRDKDEFISLQDRTNFANYNNADLFISLHCNASHNKNSNGVEVFFLSTARSNDARAVEALENSVVLDYEGGKEAVKAYDDLQFILADLQQSEQFEESSDLAVRLQTEIVSKTKAVDRGVKQAGFYVLRGAFMPAVLIEFGFISNEEEEKKLLNRSYQDKLVSAVVNGVKSFKLKYDYLW